MRSLVAAILLSTPGVLVAGGPLMGSTLSYQGVLKDAGTAANGSYDVRACLYELATGGASLVCAPEVNDVAISNGLMSVGFDFGLAVFTGESRYLELEIRAGTSTGAYTAISPRQAISPVPESLRANWSDQAVVANTAPWSGLSDVPAGFADNIDNVGAGTVTSVAAGGGLSGGTITTTGTVAVDFAQVQARINAACPAGQAFTGVSAAGVPSCTPVISEIRLGAGLQVQDPVGPTSINANSQMLGLDDNVWQFRVSGSCPTGQYLTAISHNGSVTCETLPTSLSATTIADVGTDFSFAAVQGADGFPRIVYQHESGANTITRFVRCADASCSSKTDVEIYRAARSGVGYYNVALALATDGTPVIVTEDSVTFALRVIKCADVSCTTVSTNAIDTPTAGNTVGNTLAVAIDSASGRPLIAYSGSAGGGLVRVARCANAACTSATFAALATGLGSANGLGVNLALDSAGLPRVLFQSISGLSLELAICANAACTSGTTLNVIAPSGPTFSYPSMRLTSTGELRFVRSALGGVSGHEAGGCVVPCAAGASVGIIQEPAGPAINWVKSDLLVATGSLPVVVIGENANNRLWAGQCYDSDCSDGAEVHVLVDDADTNGDLTILAGGADQMPLVLYESTTHELQLHPCANRACR